MYGEVKFRHGAGTIPWKSSWPRLVIWSLLVLLLAYLAPRAYLTIRFAGTAHEPSSSSDFSDAASFLAKPDSSVSVVLSGLSHNYFDSETFMLEVWMKPISLRHGYPFRRKARKVSDEFSAILVDVFSEASSIEPYRGPKLCGGFHADFFAEFRSSARRSRVLVCFGCGEALLFSGSESRIVDLSDKAFDRLDTAWREQEEAF